MPFSYPKTKKIDVVDEYFGVEVPDSFQWLEDDQSAETTAWVETQNAFTFNYLNKLSKHDEIKNRLTELWNYEKYSLPKLVNGQYYFWKNDGLQKQSALYRTDNYDTNSEFRLILDPNKLSSDGSFILMDLAYSKSGKYLAFGVSDSGSDWLTVSVLDLDTLEILSESVAWLKR